MTAMMGQGIGPLENDHLRSRAAEVLRNLDLITLREQRASLPLLRRLGVDEDRIVATGDDAIELAHAARPARLGDALGVNLRAAGYAGVDDGMIERIGPCFRRVREELNAPAIAIPIVLTSDFFENDANTARRLLQDDSADETEFDLPRVLERVGRCRVVVVGSYHAAVLALSMGVPAIGLYRTAYYRDKFLGLADMFGEGCWALPLDVPDLETVLVETAATAWRTAEELRPPCSRLPRSRCGRVMPHTIT